MCRSLIAVGIFVLPVVPGLAPAQSAGGSGEHWAFQPVERPAVPEGEGTANPIDAFVRAALAENGLAPAAPADRVTQVRRLFLNLHGLPPAPERVAEFVAAADLDAAYSELVDELLASPRYGERWAQHWLDLVRYADTHGYEVNTERPNAWPYRDYVIRAFNEDKPFDRFAFEQLAGDTMGEDAATGFLVAAAVLLPGQIGKDEASKRKARQDALDEIVVGTSETFLALSVGCARCHDHKSDPIPQRDYYAMQAFFAGVEYGERAIGNPGNELRLAELDAEIAAIEAGLDAQQPAVSMAGFVLIDDEDATRTTILKAKNGHGVNPAGTGRGYKDDPGGVDRVPNLSAGRYTWWDNVAGEDVFTYEPGMAGTFRVWLSWGVHGSGVHTRDARYLLDLDGDLSTRDDQTEIATADQYYFAGVTTGESEMQPLWSGLFDAGLHSLQTSSRIVLRAGETGTGITADAILLESADEAGGPERFPNLRAPVSPQRNVERFAPVEAKFVRFTVLATIDDNRHEPCLDELEVYAAGGGANVARGGVPDSSGDYPGDPQHQLGHINDGRHGNGRSWISNQAGAGWVQIELAERTRIDRITWGRDRNGEFVDRLAQRYRIEVAVEPGQWTTVARSDDRLPPGTPFDPAAALVRRGPEHASAAIRADADKLAGLRMQRADLAERDQIYAGAFRVPDPTHVLLRGDPEQKAELLGPAVPATLGSLTISPDAPERGRRVALANWIASADNPLTARVIVNRIWQYHFGRGLVDTASDFGLNGARPSHPELLDWLAAEFIRDGWSLKALHRKILLSRTFRQSSRIDPAARAIDADGRLLWHFPARRLEAEAIRDGMLAVSGKLNLATGGPGFDLFGSRGGLNGFPVIESFEADGLRRMIYAHKVRMERAPIFGAFDCPDAGQTTARRRQSTTAIQALNLFNGQFVIDQAEAFARRVRGERGEEVAVAAQVSRAFQLAFGRDPRTSEARASEEVVRTHGLATLCRVLYNSNEFLFLP